MGAIFMKFGRAPAIKKTSWRLLFSFIDFLAVTGAKHDNVVALYVEDHAIIADAETVAAELRVSQPFVRRVGADCL
jgi:hypothetical protein